MRNPSPVESPTDKPSPPRYTSASPTVADADRLALGWLLDPDPDKGSNLSERIVARRIQAEAHEPNPHFRTDHRIAAVIVLASARGERDPIGYAWRSVMRCRPEQVWPNIVNTRKLKLGAEYYEWYDSHDNLRPDIPQFQVPADQVLAPRTALFGPEAGETHDTTGTETPNRVSPALPEKKSPQPSSDGKRGVA